MKKRVFKFIAIAVVAGALAVPTVNHVSAKEAEGKIYDGVYLDSVYVGGLTKEEALSEYAEYIKGIENLTLTFTAETGNYITTLGEIDISVSPEEAVEQAYNYGRQGNILSRYKEIRGLEKENAILIPDKKFSKEVLEKKLETETGNMVTAAENASIAMEDGEFVVSPGVDGTAVNAEETIKNLEEFFKDAWVQDNVVLDAVIKNTEPQYTEEDFKMIDSVLGTYSTQYTGGNSNRTHNLINGASRVNGTVVMPGEQFSMNKALGDRTEANGYAMAGQYVKNELTDGVGGGICQVSTTLYNAVLIAELQVDERYPHSLTVAYVKLGRDAAIAGDYMDFKFTNDTEYPIYIAGYAGGGSISFSVYGHNSRPDNRTIDFESRVISTYEPDNPEEIMDDTLEEGKRVTEESPHTGYYVELWKLVYENGVLVDKYLVPWGKSQYSKTNGKVRVGTKKVESTEAPTEPGDNPDTPSSETPSSTEAPPNTEAPTSEEIVEAAGENE